MILYHYIYMCIIYIIMLYQQRGCPGIQERCVERQATAMYDMERVPSKMEVDMHTHMQYIYIYMQGHTRISYNMHVHDCALVSKSGLIGLIGFWSDAWSTIFMTQGSCFFLQRWPWENMDLPWIWYGWAILSSNKSFTIVDTVPSGNLR